MDELTDLTPDYRRSWVVMIGTQYVAGLGRTYEGYRNQQHLPASVGIVITGLKGRAMQFTSRREAGALARSIGGQVVREN